MEELEDDNWVFHRCCWINNQYVAAIKNNEKAAMINFVTGESVDIRCTVPIRSVQPHTKTSHMPVYLMAVYLELSASLLPMISFLVLGYLDNS